MAVKRLALGRGDGYARGAQQRQRHRVRRHADAPPCRVPAVTMSGTRVAPAQHERERTGPAGARRAARRGPASRATSARAAADVGHVHDHRIPRRSPLGRVDARHRLGVERVGAQAVHGLGGEGDELTALQSLGGVGDRLGGGGSTMGMATASLRCARRAMRSTSDGAMSLSMRPTLPRQVITRSRSRAATAAEHEPAHSSVLIVSDGCRR